MGKAAPKFAFADDLAPSPVPAPRQAEPEPKPRAQTLHHRAEPTTLYLSPEVKTWLRVYAAQRGRGVKVHDILMDVVAEWAASQGFTGDVRVPSLRETMKT